MSYNIFACQRTDVDSFQIFYNLYSNIIAAVILQLFYNYIVSKIDSLVNDMEDSSITLMDILTAYKK